MENLPVPKRSVRGSTYLMAFVITAAIFGTAFYLAKYFSDQRIADVRATQDNISTDILSIETQFDLLQEHSCSDIVENTILPSELSTLGNQLSAMEAQGSSKSEVLRLKRLYSLLEIKDYLLMKQIAGKCNLKPVFILYFYSNKADCADCQKQGYALTALAETYPQLRIYSFDYDLDVSALQTLIAIDDVADTLPALVIDGNVYYGFQSIDAIRSILPEIDVLPESEEASATANTAE